MGTTWFGVGVDVLGLALATAFVLGPQGLTIWPVTRFWVTVIHETGHAAITLVTPGRVRRVLVHANSSAETYSEEDSDGAPGVLFLLCGYPAPSLLGLAGVYAVARGWATFAMIAALGVLTFVLALMRNLLGVAVALALGGAFAGYFRYGPESGRPLFVLVASWILLLGAVRTTYEQYTCADEGDADSLGQISAFPPGAWRVFFVVFSVVAAGTAGWLVFF